MATNTSSKIHAICLLFVTAVFIWSAIWPTGYLIWTMEVLPAVVGLIAAIALYKKFRLTSLSYVIIAFLSILMFIGGHYTYAKVPVFNWVKDYFDLHRNNYDRVGHFFKGFIVIVIREIILRKTSLTRGPWVAAVVLSFSLAIAALYEIIEWLAAKIMNGNKASTDFLGTQGDIWDSQWDMSLTLIGSIFALGIFSKLHTKLLQKKAKKSSIIFLGNESKNRREGQ